MSVCLDTVVGILIRHRREQPGILNDSATYYCQTDARLSRYSQWCGLCLPHVSEKLGTFSDWGLCLGKVSEKLGTFSDCGLCLGKVSEKLGTYSC